MAHYIPRVTERRDGEVGAGGRSSDAGVTVAIFGAGGFLGRYICSNLGTNGVKTYVGNRGDEFEMRYLKPCYDLGRLKFQFYSPRDRESMREVIADADIVINLIGKYYETRSLSNTDKFPYLQYKTNFSFQEANVDIPRAIAELCTEMQVDNLIHMSCMSARPDSNSAYARSKYQGELAVKEAYPWATIVRPTQLFGPEDRLLNFFAVAPRTFPFVPLIDGGKALTQPVYCCDVADVVTKIVDQPDLYEGKTVHVFGPEDYTYKELAAFVYDITGQDPRLWELPKVTVRHFATLTQFQPINPWLTPDLVELWSEDCIAPMTQHEYANQTDIIPLTDMGLKQTPMEKVAFSYLHRFRTGGHFMLSSGYHGEYHEDYESQQLERRYFSGRHE